MKSKMFLSVLLFAAVVFVAPSCNQVGDTTKPVIDLHEPEDGECFKPGSEICLEMDLSDNIALESFKINIHNAFDGHEHEHAHAPAQSATRHGDEHDDYNTDADHAFTYDKTSEELGKDINGLKNAHQHIHIEIPADAACGDYHLMVYCYDVDKNESHVARSIAITKDAEEHEHDHEL